MRRRSRRSRKRSTMNAIWKRAGSQQTIEYLPQSMYKYDIDYNVPYKLRAFLLIEYNNIWLLIFIHTKLYMNVCAWQSIRNIHITALIGQNKIRQINIFAVDSKHNSRLAIIILLYLYCECVYMCVSLQCYHYCYCYGHLRTTYHKLLWLLLL